MKLYATVSSERATKGQGGKRLFIDIMAEDKSVIAKIYVNEDSITLEHYNKSYVLNVIEIAKGERQKGVCGVSKGYDVCDIVDCDHGGRLN